MKCGACVAHEVMHVANGHCWRQGARDPDRWNDACDYAINPIVLSAGLVLPKGALIDARYTGKSAEEIYGVAHAGGEAETAATASAAAIPTSNRNRSNQDPQGQPAAGSGRISRAVRRDAGQAARPAVRPAAVSESGPFGEVRPYKGPDKPVKEAEWKVAVTAGRESGGDARQAAR